MPDDELVPFEEGEPWEQQEGEPLLWFDLFSKYKLLGINRNMRKLFRVVRASRGQGDITAPGQNAPSNWWKIARQWNWKERAAAWDEYQIELQEDATLEIMGSGLALAHERVKHLKEMANTIETMLMSGDAKNFSFTLEQYRGLLDDIAKELGQRVKETRLTGPAGGPVVIQTEWGRGGSASAAWDNKPVIDVTPDMLQIEEPKHTEEPPVE